jgi:uncharacterized protein YbaR (Trm112 family)
MIDPRLLAVLVCPETHVALRAADQALVAKLNHLAAEGRLRNRRGDLLASPIEGGLLRQDGRLFFPIIDGIPVMLIDEAIPVEPGQDNQAR